MGWGNPTPIADLKRRAGQVARLNERLAEIEVERDTALEQLARLRALFPPQQSCAFCLSAYAECLVHNHLVRPRLSTATGKETP